ATKTVRKDPYPLPQTNGPDTVCRNTSGHIYYTPQKAGSVFTWSVIGRVITSGQNTDSITVTCLGDGPGPVSKRAISASGCDTTISTSITIQTRPLPVISGLDTVCRNTTGVTYSTPNNAGAFCTWSITNGVITAGQNTNAVTVTWLSTGTGVLSVKETNTL